MVLSEYWSQLSTMSVVLIDTNELRINAFVVMLTETRHNISPPPLPL